MFLDMSLGINNTWMHAIIKDIHQAMQQQVSSYKNYLGKNISVTAFIEYLQPPVSLVVVGAILAAATVGSLLLGEPLDDTTDE